MYLQIQQLAYRHADHTILFENINFSVDKGQKIALIGNNGSGKSTLLRLINGELEVLSGNISRKGTFYFVPQHFGQYNNMTIAEALQIDKKLKALHAILKGDSSIESFNILNDEWDIEEKAHEALAVWGIDFFELERPFSSLSGGEKTKVFLAGITIHKPTFILMDEPSNHLDTRSREQLYQLIQTSNTTMLVISHDRNLLNLLPYTYELHKNGVIAYGGNYEFYKEEKEKKIEALQEEIHEKEKQLKLMRKIARQTDERQQKHAVRGKKNNQQKGIPRIVLNSLKSKSENTASKLKDIHSGKEENIQQNLSQIRQSIPDIRQMKINFNPSTLHTGKTLITAKNINYSFSAHNLWENDISFQITSNDRISIEGANGSGKTTLLKLITDKLTPTSGNFVKAPFDYIYIDQDYQLIQNQLTIYEQAQQFNSRSLPEHEIKMILNRFLFPKENWEKKCSKLSGGEKMRLALCCLMINENTPDLFILDEPTNNIDLLNVEILTAALRDYHGALLVVSHDSYFKREIRVEKQLIL